MSNYLKKLFLKKENTKKTKKKLSLIGQKILKSTFNEINIFSNFKSPCAIP